MDREQMAEEAKKWIDEMLESDECTDVENFLYSVREWIEEKGFITQGQYDGIENCYEVYEKKRDK